MFSKELENLIEAALADGIIEEHEKEALIKRAQKEGVDLAELDIYIDSIRQKRIQNQEVQINKETASHEKLRLGNVCPHCSEAIPPLTKICPACGRAINANETSGDKELFNLIESISTASVKVKGSLTIEDFKQAKAECEGLLKKASVFYGENQKVQMLVFDLKEEISKAESKWSSSTRNKAITKIAIFVILAVVLVGCAYFGWSKWNEQRIAEDPSAATEAINNAIQSGDLRGAESYIVAFSEKHLIKADDIVSSVISLADALVKNKEYDKALSLDDYLNTGSLTFIPAVCSQLVKAGEYYKAMGKMLSFTHKGADEALSLMRECIIQMKSQNVSPDELRQFIGSYYPKGSGYEDGLYNLAGI